MASAVISAQVLPRKSLASNAKYAKVAIPCFHCPAKAFNVCKPLDYERQKELFETGVQQIWRRRQFLFRMGDLAGPIFKITSGIVAVSKPLLEGRRQVSAFLLPGEVCGYLETNGGYAFDGEAITEVRTCSFNRRQFHAFVAANRDVDNEVKAALEERLQQVGQQQAVLGQLTSTERVASFLLTMTRDYSAHGMQTRPLWLPMSRADIADYLGLRIETVSRAFAKLKHRKVLGLDDEEVVIHDLKRLTELAGI
jgi:CRP/FNR family transcriptional regulator